MITRTCRVAALALVLALCAVALASAQLALEGFFHVRTADPQNQYTIRYACRPSGECQACPAGSTACRGRGQRPLACETARVPGVFDIARVQANGTWDDWLRRRPANVVCTSSEPRLEPPSEGEPVDHGPSLGAFEIVNVLLALLSGSVVVWRRKVLEEAHYQSLSRRLGL